MKSPWFWENKMKEGRKKTIYQFSVAPITSLFLVFLNSCPELDNYLEKFEMLMIK